MARPLRIEFSGAFYHLTARGDRREAIDEDDEDRRAFLDIFACVVEQFLWRCHAYCLMTNHYHLFVETGNANLSKGMRQLNGVFTQWSTIAFTWVNTMIGNVKNSLYGSYHAIGDAHLPRYLAEFCYRFNRRFKLEDMIPRLGYAAVRTPPMPQRLLSMAEARG